MTGIIFDIDGTIWDSSAILAETYNRVIRTYLHRTDIELTDCDIKRNLGKSTTAFMEGVLPMLTDDERALIAGPCFETSNEVLRQTAAPLFDGIRETIRTLSETYPLFIVSNCQVGYIEAMLSVTGLAPYVKDFVSNGETGKPKGENIRLIIERNHLEKAVYIGDTQGDYEACLYAGIPFIWASYGFGSVPDASMSVRHASELPDLIKSLS